MSNRQISFEFEILGLKGSVLHCHTAPNIMLTIESETISKANDEVEDYLHKNFLKADSITLKKITM